MAALSPAASQTYEQLRSQALTGIGAGGAWLLLVRYGVAQGLSRWECAAAHRNPSALAAVFPEQGFVYAVQDVRGRNESEGEFIACTGQDREDGWDTVDWLTRQPW